MNAYEARAFHLASGMVREDLILMVARADDFGMQPEERAAYNQLLTDDEKRALTDPDHPFWQHPAYRVFRPTRRNDGDVEDV
jgi:hypothetical protein